MRFRHIFMGVGTVFVLFLVFFSDPSVGVLSQLPFGSGLLGILVGLAISQLYIGLLHISHSRQLLIVPGPRGGGTHLIVI